MSQIPAYLSPGRENWVPVVYWSDDIVSYFEAVGPGLSARLITRFLYVEEEVVRPDLWEKVPGTLDILASAVDAIVEVLKEVKYQVIFLSDALYRRKSAPFKTGEQEFFLGGLLAKISLDMLLEEEVVLPLIESIAWEAGGGLLFGECNDPNWQTLSDIKGYKSFGYLFSAFEGFGHVIYCTKSFADRLPETCEYDWEDD